MIQIIMIKITNVEYLHCGYHGQFLVWQWEYYDL